MSRLTSVKRTRDALESLGLTGLEAEIYMLLLQDSPLTGYAIAKALGKSVANVYKALESLAAKGAIEVDQGKTRRYRPLPAEDFLGILELRFRRLREQAAEGLHDLPGPDQDVHIYHLKTRDRVLQKCDQLLSDARLVAVVDLGLESPESLLGSLESAASRGVDVGALVYRSLEISGVEVVLDADRETTRWRWPANWVSLAVDGSHMLAALFSGDGNRVIQAYWSSSPFVSWLHHAGLSNELLVTAMRNQPSDNDLPIVAERLDSLYRRFVTIEGSGYDRLLAQLESHPSSTSGSQEDPS